MSGLGRPLKIKWYLCISRLVLIIDNPVIAEDLVQLRCSFLKTESVLESVLDLSRCPKDMEFKSVTFNLASFVSMLDKVISENMALFVPFWRKIYLSIKIMFYMNNHVYTRHVKVQREQSPQWLHTSVQVSPLRYDFSPHSSSSPAHGF